MQDRCVLGAQVPARGLQHHLSRRAPRNIPVGLFWTRRSEQRLPGPPLASWPQTCIPAGPCNLAAASLNGKQTAERDLMLFRCFWCILISPFI